MAPNKKKKKEWSKTKRKENRGKIQENKSFPFVDALSLSLSPNYFARGGGRSAYDGGGDAPHQNLSHQPLSYVSIFLLLKQEIQQSNTNPNLIFKYHLNK